MSKRLAVSVVLPSFNGAPWLAETLARLDTAIGRSNFTAAEIIVVDDGSADNTAEVAGTTETRTPVRVIKQKNEGRFLARKHGLEAAKYDHILFVDTRVHLGEDALKFLALQLEEHPERQIWNGHVYVAKKGNVIARFMDAIVLIGWRRYFNNPKTTSYGLKDFDYYPKGTGCFFAPKDKLIAAIAEFEATTNDLKFSSDDTLLIRILARDSRINLSPGFDCTYYARNTMRQFVKHTYHRGQFFVDGFLRRGTRFFYPLIGVLTGSVAALVLIALYPQILLPVAGVLAVIWLAEFVVALLLGVPAKDSFSLFLLTPVFTFFYWLGLWRGLLRKF